MTDPANPTPALSQVQAAPVASPTPSQPSPGAQGPPPSTAEAGKWYDKVDGAMGDNKADPPNPGGTGQPQPGDQSAQPQPDGLHGEPPSQLQQALPPRQYGEFKLPEGMQGNLDPGTIRQFTEALDASRGDHQVAGQRLFDMHLAEIKKVGEQRDKYQRDVWNRTIETRINDAKSDPNIGGQRFETVLSNAKYAMQQHLGLQPDEVQQLMMVMDAGGVCSHRLMIKALNNLYERFMPRPVEAQAPSASKIMSNPGNRDWYSSVDGTQRSGPR
jgi:hypothetical protein